VALLTFTVTRETEKEADRGQPNFPFVEFIGGPVILPVTVAQKEVNIVPLDLTWFLEKQPNCKASFGSWENRRYRGELQVVPV
jgi:hypothetical protein